MSINKPLKGREYFLHHIYNREVYRIRMQKNQKLAVITGFKKDDVKSAVEWLKEAIKPCDIPKGKNLVLDLIDKAFVDIK